MSHAVEMCWDGKQPPSIGKYVRPNHLQTPERWETKWEKNLLGV